ncbi:hypothetical protein OHA21_49600 [Actinoplanes sp. NBC_00393]
MLTMGVDEEFLLLAERRPARPVRSAPGALAEATAPMSLRV